MSYILYGAGILVALSALGFALLFRRLVSPANDPHSNLEWCSRFSLADYPPMERLFCDEDYSFLAAQPGAPAQLSKRLRAARRRIFRQYLRCLSRDFDRLYRAAKLLLLHSPQDQPGLASALLRQRLIFRYSMLAVQCRLVLQTVGLSKVDVRGLVGPLDALQHHLRQLDAGIQRSAA